MSMTTAPTCPECGQPMVLRTANRYRYPNGEPRKFFGCSAFPQCRAAHGAHPDGRPCGIPGDAETRAARRRAHAAFDPLWRGGSLTQRRAYEMLREVMGLTEDEAHIGRFTVGQCEQLVRLLKRRELWDPKRHVRYRRAIRWAR